jgi:hypothetical protein
VSPPLQGWLYLAPITLGCVFLAAFLFVRVRQGVKIGAQYRPLSGEDRLRVSLVLRSLEDAERGLLKAAWRDNQPGHPAIGDLLLMLKETATRARQLLREH